MNARALIMTCGLLLAPTALAAPVTYEFSGTLSFLAGEAENQGFALGERFTGTLTYDNSATLSPGLAIDRQGLLDAGLQPLAAGEPTPDTGGGFFHDGMADGLSESGQAAGDSGLFTLEFEVNGSTFTTENVGDEQSSFLRHRTNEWINTPDRPAFAYDSLLASSTAQTFQLDADGNVVDAFLSAQTGLRLFDNEVFSGTFPLDQALATLPDLKDLFRARVFAFADLDGDGSAESNIWGEVDSLSLVSVPAPGAGLPLLLGLGLLGLRRR